MPADDPQILERFHGSLDLVERVALQLRRVVGPGVETDELRSFAREGLLDAARKFEPERGVPFRAYATFRVRGAVIDGLRQLGRLPRRLHGHLSGYEAASRVSEGAAEDVLAGPEVPGDGEDRERALDTHLAAMATAIAVGLVARAGLGEEGEPAAVDAESSPEDALSRARLHAEVRAALGALPADEETLVRRHYFEGERFDRVAADLGLSKSWASRLHTRALGRLAKRLRGREP